MGRRQVASLATAVVLLVAFAAAARAATYEASRPALTISFTTQRRHIHRVHYQVKLYCGTRPGGFLYGGFGSIAVDRKTGRFEAETSQIDVGAKIKGVVRDKSISGYLSAYISVSSNCETRGANGHWVRFVTRRQ